MRRLILTVFFSVLLSIAYAQSLRIVNTSNKVLGRIGAEVEAPIIIKNVSSKPVEFKVTRTEKNISSGQESYFCLGKNCYSPQTNTSTDTKTIRPGEIYEGFKSVLKAGLGRYSSNITYCFQNIEDPSDELCYTLNYQVESQASNEVLYFNEDITISNIYPNPINEIALFDYTIKNSSIKAKLVLHNVLGGIVGEYPLNEYENKLKVYTQSFKPGVYFYTLNIENQNLVTKKFVIKR